jgi:putative two-component system response regulator
MNSSQPETGLYPALERSASIGLFEAAEPLPHHPVREDSEIDQTEGILFALAQAVEYRDQNTAEHCERLALTSLAMGMAMSLDEPALAALYRGGYLHDIGKVGIPDAILFKPGKLTAQEWVVMRSHPVRGEDICRHLKSFRPMLPIIRHHHERWDGSGYPDGIRGAQIPLLARIVQVVDIYDALTNPRPYKPAFNYKQAIGVIEEETARGWRDPEVVDLFLRLPITGIDRVAQYIRTTHSRMAAMDTSIANLNQIFA